MKLFKKNSKKEKLPTVYDEHGEPLRVMRPETNDKRHKFQRPTIFTKTEVDEIKKKFH